MLQHKLEQRIQDTGQQTVDVLLQRGSETVQGLDSRFQEALSDLEQNAGQQTRQHSTKKSKSFG